MTQMTAAHIDASMEVSAKHVHDGKLQPGMMPDGTRVYITDVGVDPVASITDACRKIEAFGYVAVPHIPARRIESLGALDARLGALASEAGVRDILIIAGEADQQMGPYSSTLDVLKTGLVKQHGFAHVAVGGHPEGNPAYSGANVMSVLAEKVARAADDGANVRITTQFGFDGPAFVNWAQAVADAGIEAPIHLGVAGPARITTLIKYAAMCGVGNSLNFFKKRTGAIAQLATKHSPEDVVSPIEQAWREGVGNLAQLHVFPFGGLQASADWLYDRGSYVKADTAA
ncbi:MAG: methylenetetrahydrofolate reductase [Pseudomonadota bacterium]